MQKEVYEFISQQTNDPIIEWRTCAISGEEFAIFQSDAEFYDKVSPIFGGKKYQIPFPTLCPNERQRRRLMFRNERKLYKGICALTRKPIISMYSPDKDFTIYDQDVWWSDNWDGLNYGKEFDFTKTFAEQFKELVSVVPRYSLFNINSTNSIYTNLAGNNNDCYLIFGNGNGNNEGCMYGNYLNKCISCIDTYFMSDCRNCYSCIDCINCDQLTYSISSENCSNSAGLYNCVNCDFCMNSTNLQNKKYYYNNQKYSKDEYFTKIVSAKYSFPINDIYVNQLKINTDNVIGNNVNNCSDSVCLFDCNNVRNGKYIYRSSIGCNDVMDVTQIDNADLIYDCISIGVPGNNILFSFNVVQHVQHVLYSDICNNVEYCFGCIALQHKSYCILNKQYTKEEYEQLVPKIIGHMKQTGEWGEFLHPSLTPFGYNETVAQEYFPLTKEEAFTRGYKRQDKEYPINIPESMEKIYPKNIEELSDEILTKAIICEVSGKPFRIIKPELEFYKKYKLPIPRKHPDIRHKERMEKRAGRELYLRSCDKTGEKILSVYPQDVPFEVYSEEAYQQEIYG